MTFNEFKYSVEQWAAERGIYEHSSVEAQLLKTLSELGELADAIIKTQKTELEDAIGDVAVCIVNAAKMAELEIDKPMFDFMSDETPAELVGAISTTIGNALIEPELHLTNGYLQFILCCLVGICQRTHNPDFVDCCKSAWLEIKDRSGKMSAGGAFVKDV